MADEDDTASQEKMMSSKPVQYRFKKVPGDEDSRDVVKGDEVIGRIHHVWTRLGGWGWNHGIVGKTHRSMKDAARELEKNLSR